MSTLRKNLRKGVVVSTSYSGNGTAEFAAAEICRAFNAVADASGPTVQARMYSACDWDVAARKVLLAHGNRTAPAHVFNNIVDRVDEKSRASLEAALKLVQIHVVSQLDDVHSQVRPPEKSRKQTRGAIIAKLGKQIARQRAYFFATPTPRRMRRV